MCMCVLIAPTTVVYTIFSVDICSLFSKHFIPFRFRPTFELCPGAGEDSRTHTHTDTHTEHTHMGSIISILSVRVSLSLSFRLLDFDTRATTNIVPHHHQSQCTQAFTIIIIYSITRRKESWDRKKKKECGYQVLLIVVTCYIMRLHTHTHIRYTRAHIVIPSYIEIHILYC